MSKAKAILKLFRNYFSLGLRFKMVRHFENPYEDYKAGEVNIESSGICRQIDQHVKTILTRLPPLHRHVDGGLYVGVGGVAYMFYHLAKNPLLSANKKHYVEKGIEYIKPALETTTGDKTSFLLGDAGTYAVATVLLKEKGDAEYKNTLSKYQALYRTFLNPSMLKCGSDEFFVGRAGYLAAALWLTRELQAPVFTKEELYALCDVIVESGRMYSDQHSSPSPLMYHYYNTEYLGAAHGIAAILQMLLSVPGYLESNRVAAVDIKNTVTYLAKLQTPEGNWPCCMEEISHADHKLVHWCHGAPGMVYLMAKAFLVMKDRLYLDACIKAADLVWEKGLLRKGPGICHGVAGNGYVFLLLYRLTGDVKYLYRAKVFGEFMSSELFLKEARVPDNPQTLYEGTAGAVCYLSDLLVPEKAEFPFQDVFS
ncbi:hypothetical protein JYU34_014205 [Plutella xylostella]|uniref:Lancl1 protein n=1 Tax=Plutella xylostella TaxID=51655 RepID=A0ABQ7Q820_PLUXY|nr:hypothetical protein JYU34_014205 [Plutella xylostella]